MRLDRKLISFLLLLGSLALYVLTLHRGLAPLDSSEFVTAIRIQGVPHPPGFPLLVLLGIAFSKIPGLALLFRIHLLSAICGSLAVLLTYHAARLVTESPAASGVAASVLATSLFFWPQCVVIEVFGLHCAIVAGAMLTTLQFRRSGDPRFLYASAFLLGLGICNHHAIVFLIPALAWLVWPQMASGRDRIRLGLLVLALLVGLLPYLYLPWAASRHPPLNTGDPSSPDRFLAVLLRRAYGTLSLSENFEGNRWANLGGQLWHFAYDLGIDNFCLGFALMIFGFYRLRRRDPRLAGAIGLALFLNLPVFLYLANAPVGPLVGQVLRKHYGIPLVLLTFCLAEGLAALKSERRIAVLGLLPLFMAWQHFPLVDRSSETLTQEFGTQILGSLDRNAIVFSCYDTVNFVLHELTDAEGERPDVIVASFAPAVTEAQQIRARLPGVAVSATEGDAFSRELIQAVGSARPIYFTFAGRCDGKDLLGELREHLLPMGLVYRWDPTPTPAQWHATADQGLARLQAWPASASARASEHPWDAGVREEIGWIADAYANLAVAYARVGDLERARRLAGLAERIRN